jgi:hypothetical protein
VSESAVPTLCVELDRSCRSPEKGTGQLVVWYRAPSSNPSAITRLEQACMFDGVPPERRPEDLVVTVTEKQLRELPIAAPGLGSQPGQHTLKGTETNIYATPAEQTFAIVIVGRKVDVKVAPAEYRWDYGDGTTLTTSAPGGPVPESRWGEKTVTSHAFTATGDFTVRLTTVFTGEFSVDGGPYQQIAGTAPVPSQPRTLSVWRSEVKQYADDCNVNPQGAGCQ